MKTKQVEFYRAELKKWRQERRKADAIVRMCRERLQDLEGKK